MHPILLPLLLLATLTTVYALLLATPLGRAWTQHLTWTTVVAGVALVLAALALYDWCAAALALLFFAVGGTPIVVGELIEDFRVKRAIERRSLGPKP